MALTVERIGRSSLATRVEGRQGHVHCFTGTFVCAFVDAVRMCAIPIPERIRANIRSYAERQGAPFEDASGS
jgi:acyl-CoA thioesterase FadM